jgi:transcriptional regulator with XRE-family HTH domain/Tfp pilus assembly protein PilF
MTVRTLTPSATIAALRSPSTLGARVRQLRQAAGLTQDELAADRCSKEYISQIERGKTRPTAATLEWIAGALSVDVTYLETGQSWSEYAAVEAAVARAEAAVEGQHYEDAVEILSGLRYSPDAPELELRGLLAQSWANLYFGDVQQSLELLAQARTIAENDVFSDVERAEVLYRMGVCRYKLSSINSSLLLLNEALDLAERSGLPCDRLRADILEWRSRCSRRQRDFEAAREDIELALELAESLEDTLTVAHVMFQGSLVAERSGNWVRARTLAERAKDLYEHHGDRLNYGRMLNNLGGLEYLLGKPDDAVGYLKRAFSVALELGSDADAAQAVSSLAQVHLGTGDVELAEEQSRHALELLGDREDFVDEIGNAQIVLGRSLLEQGRLDEAQQMFEEAEASFAQLSSASHRAVAWTAQGDVASKRGDAKTAATLYRRAAEALQDVRF